MVVNIIYIIFVLFLLFLISLSYVTADIQIHRIKEDDNILIIIKLLFGIIRLKFEIPYIDILLNRNLKPGIKAKGRVDTKKRKGIAKSKGWFSFERIKDKYVHIKELKKQYESAVKYIIKKTRVDLFKWYTRLGLDDAAATAITTGILWSLKSSVCCLLSANTQPQNILINVVPDYSMPVFETEIHCIIRIKIANIIIAGFRIGAASLKKVILRRGGVNERTSYSRVNENYNG